MSLPSTAFINNRDRFFDRIPVDSAVILFAGSSRKMSQDSEYRFLPDRNFYWLMGLSVETAKLILIKREELREVFLFIPPKDAKVERWHGKRLTSSEVSAITGLAEDEILPLGDFEEKLYAVTHDASLTVFQDGSSVSDENSAFIKSGGVMKDISSVFTALRMVKSEDEIEAIRKAAKITEEALEEMKAAVVAGASERDIYTALEYGLTRRGSLLQAFPTITAIDGNCFYLHHSDPEGPEGPVIKDGSFVQIDVGARVDGYCADISRVYFAGEGDEVTKQRRSDLLGLIRELRREAFAFIKPGESFKTLNAHIRGICGKWLADKGLLSAEYTNEDVGKYYWHNTGHHLGLDVHDISDREAVFEEGNCLAIEPGVYIPEWDIGFRIEDDVLVTKDGCVLLSSGTDTPDSVYLS